MLRHPIIRFGSRQGAVTWAYQTQVANNDTLRVFPVNRKHTKWTIEKNGSEIYTGKYDACEAVIKRERRI